MNLCCTTKKNNNFILKIDIRFECLQFLTAIVLNFEEIVKLKFCTLFYIIYISRKFLEHCFAHFGNQVKNIVHIFSDNN